MIFVFAVLNLLVCVGLVVLPVNLLVLSSVSSFENCS